MLENQQEALEIFVIYKNPSDYPDEYVVRRFLNDIPDLKPFAVENNLYLSRLKIPEGKVCVARSKDDDSVIVESWI